MLLVFIHICVALASVLTATLTLIKPSLSRFAISGLLTGLTLISGTFLIISRHAGLAGACLSGLIYLTIVVVELFFARRRFVKILANMPH